MTDWTLQKLPDYFCVSCCTLKVTCDSATHRHCHDDLKHFLFNNHIILHDIKYIHGHASFTKFAMLASYL